MIGLIRADILKVMRRRGVWLSTLLIPAGFTLLVGLLGALIGDLGVHGGGQFTEDVQYVLGLMSSVVGALLGARLGSDEHVLQTFRYQVLSGRTRAQLYFAKVGALLVVLTITVAVATVVTILAAFLPQADPQDTISLADLGNLFWQLWLPVQFYGCVALGVGAMLRASGGAIAISLLLQFVGLNLITLLANLWIGFKYVGVSLALDRLGPDTIDDEKYRLAVVGAIITLAVWLAIFITAGLLRTQRSED